MKRERVSWKIGEKKKGRIQHTHTHTNFLKETEREVHGKQKRYVLSFIRVPVGERIRQRQYLKRQ